MTTETYQEKNGMWGFVIRRNGQSYPYTAYQSEYEAIIGLIYSLEKLAEEKKNEYSIEVH